MPKKNRRLAKERAIKCLRTVTNVEIDAHPLLDESRRQICKELRDLAKRLGEEFSMLAFALVELRKTAGDYAEAGDDIERAVIADNALRRAAMLYVYECLRHGPKIVTETMEKRGTLRDLELLASHGDLA